MDPRQLANEKGREAWEAGVTDPATIFMEGMRILASFYIEERDKFEQFVALFQLEREAAIRRAKS